jgi:hypothetical protein
MTDVAPSRRAQALDFTRRKRWEVVVVNVALAGFDAEVIEALFFGW